MLLALTVGHSPMDQSSFRLPLWDALDEKEHVKPKKKGFLNHLSLYFSAIRGEGARFSVSPSAHPPPLRLLLSSGFLSRGGDLLPPE